MVAGCEGACGLAGQRNLLDGKALLAPSPSRHQWRRRRRESEQSRYTDVAAWATAVAAASAAGAAGQPVGIAELAVDTRSRQAFTHTCCWVTAHSGRSGNRWTVEGGIGREAQGAAYDWVWHSGWAYVTPGARSVISNHTPPHLSGPRVTQLEGVFGCLGVPAFWVWYCAGVWSSSEGTCAGVGIGAAGDAGIM